MKNFERTLSIIQIDLIKEADLRRDFANGNTRFLNFDLFINHISRILLLRVSLPNFSLSRLPAAWLQLNETTSCKSRDTSAINKKSERERERNRERMARSLTTSCISFPFFSSFLFLLNIKHISRGRSVDLNNRGWVLRNEGGIGK